MSPYRLLCSVCQTTCRGRGSWLAHLVTELHQTRARLDCLQWVKDERECVLVAFSDKSMESTPHVMLHYLSDRKLGAIVTDFIWWPGRQKMALIQYESRDILHKVVNSLDEGGTQLRLRNSLIQFKKATEYLEYEWDVLIVGVDGDGGALYDGGASRSVELASKESQTLVEDFHDPSRGMALNEEQLESQNHWSVKPTSAKHVSSEDNEFLGDNEPDCFEADNISSTNSSALLPTDFISQFKQVLRFIQIPPMEYSQVLLHMSKIKKILGPDYKVNMYRTWHLRLRSPGKDVLSFFVRRKTDPDGVFRPADGSLQAQLLQFEESNEHLQGFNSMRLAALPPGFDGHLYYNLENRIRFTLTSGPHRIVESQMGLLASYMCSFDARAKLLLSIVFLWARINFVTFSEKNIPATDALQNVPEPATMIWIVILFLCKKGVLPTPREIQARPHKPLYYGDFHIDIGFNPDPKFASEWKSPSKRTWKHELSGNYPYKFYKSVLILAKNFFKYFSTSMGTGSWILNTKDAEMYEMEQFLNSPPGPESNWTTQLTESEYRAVKKRVTLLKPTIYVIHPLYVTYRLSFTPNSAAIWRKFKATFNKLNKFLKCDEKISKDQFALQKALLCKKKFVPFHEQECCQTNYAFWKCEEGDKQFEFQGEPMQISTRVNTGAGPKNRRRAKGRQKKVPNPNRIVSGRVSKKESSANKIWKQFKRDLFQNSS